MVSLFSLGWRQLQVIPQFRQIAKHPFRVFPGQRPTLAQFKGEGDLGIRKSRQQFLWHSIKPILDISSGKVEEAGKARTRKRALEVLRDKVAEAGTIEHLCVTHGLAPEVDAMLDLLAPVYSRDQIRVGHIGPVIGTHGGPRVMGVTWVAAS